MAWTERDANTAVVAAIDRWLSTSGGRKHATVTPGSAEAIVELYLRATGRRPAPGLSVDALTELATALLDGLAARLHEGASLGRRRAASATVRAIEGWTAPGPPVAMRSLPPEDRVRALDEALAAHRRMTSPEALESAIELMALAPTSTLAGWRARRCAARVLDVPGIRESPLGERAWRDAAELLAMADGDRRLAEEVAQARLTALAGPIDDPLTLMRSTWLLLRLERFGAALGQLAGYRAWNELSVEQASFADALRAYALAAVGPAEQAIAAGRRAMAGSGIGVHLGAAAAIRTCVREGRLEEARDVVASAPPPPRPPSLGATALLIAQGRLAVHSGRPTEAVEILGSAIESLRRVGVRNPAGWPLLEPITRALTALSQHRRAAILLDRARDRYRAWGTPIVLAELHRAAAFLAPTEMAAKAERDAAVDALRTSEAHLERTWTIRELRDLSRGDSVGGDVPSALAGLTPRVLEVSRLVAEGLRDREIAERLHLSPRTVHRHVATALAVTGARNRVELAQLAWEGE